MKIPEKKVIWFAVVFCFELPCQRFNAKNAARKLKLTTRDATALTLTTAMTKSRRYAAVNS